jgi:hypothetical protein
VTLFAVLTLAAACNAGASLPEANPYVRALVAVQRRNEEALSLYTYDVDETREELDGDGKVARRRTRLYEVLQVKGRPVRRLVQRDGQPLSPDERERVERRTSERAEALRAGTAGGEPPGVRLSRILERYDFRAAGREEVEGRCALVFDFTPRPGDFPLERDFVLKQLAGRLWVDEAERAVVRLELRNTGSVRVAFGLAASVASARFRAEFVRLADGVWLPRRFEGSAAGRKLIFARFHVRDVMSFGNFRRLGVDVQEQARP